METDLSKIPAIVTWQTGSSLPKDLAVLDEIALACLDPNEWGSRRWLRLAPRYLGRLAHGLRLIESHREFAARLSERLNQSTDRGEIAFAFEVISYFRGIPTSSASTHPNRDQRTLFLPVHSFTRSPGPLVPRALLSQSFPTTPRGHGPSWLRQPGCPRLRVLASAPPCSGCAHCRSDGPLSWPPQGIPVPRRKPLQQLPVVRPRRHICIHQTDTQRQRLAHRKVRLDELRPLR